MRGNESDALGRATGGKGVAKPQAELRLGDGSWSGGRGGKLKAEPWQLP